MKSTRVTPQRLRLLATAAFLSVALGVTAGCNFINLGLWIIFGDPSDTLKVKAQYKAFENKSFAVLVAATDDTQYAYPGATASICRAVTARVAAGVPGAKPVSPADVIKFQKDNPDWIAVPYADLIRRLKVDRLVVVDLSQYSLRDAGNEFVRRGQIVTNVGIAEAEAVNPSNFAYSTTIKAVFPTVAPVGVVNADDDSIRQGLMDVYSMAVLDIFRDHREHQE